MDSRNCILNNLGSQTNEVSYTSFFGFFFFMQPIVHRGAPRL